MSLILLLSRIPSHKQQLVYLWSRSVYHSQECIQWSCSRHSRQTETAKLFSRMAMLGCMPNSSVQNFLPSTFLSLLGISLFSFRHLNNGAVIAYCGFNGHCLLASVVGWLSLWYLSSKEFFACSVYKSFLRYDCKYECILIVHLSQVFPENTFLSFISHHLFLSCFYCTKVEPMISSCQVSALPLSSASCPSLAISLKKEVLNLMQYKCYQTRF